ncbi:hypothetical protein A3767_01380 [Oleiphilus sp. HI0133]|nr:hypothetical protein A3767_01380 [Oleiphilus sp. HI0133]
MFCKRIVYVNWGNIPNEEFELGPINLFSGGNGSGKTTAADGLQSLMTAAHDSLYHFNPGQDETTQRGRGGKLVRTLASYVMGCDDGKYARLRMTDGYIAGVFHPTRGESAEPFTAVMCVRARLDQSTNPKQARQEEVKFLILPGQQLHLSDFIRNESSGKSVITIDEIAQHLLIQYGKKSVEEYDKKSPYLRRLYGAFRGLPKAVSDKEAKHAARTFSNFMAYKPVKSISEFVSNQVLEPKDISDDIRQVSELMKTIHGMEEETRTLKDAIENLEHASASSSNYINNWIDRAVFEYSKVSRHCMITQKEYLAAKDEQRDNTKKIETTQREIEKANDKKQALHTELVELEAKRQGISALKTKDELEAKIDSIRSELSEKAKPLLIQNHQFQLNYQAASELMEKLETSQLSIDLPLLRSAEFSKYTQNLVDGPKESPIDANKLLTQDWVDSKSLEHALENVLSLESLHKSVFEIIHHSDRDGTNKSVRDQVVALLNSTQSQMQRLSDQVKQKQNEINKLEAHRVTYPSHVSVAIDAIRQDCPQAKPAVLCDFIEVADPKWQMAIEGYIGGARFSILVEPEYEAQAIRIVRSIKGKRNSARVIQGGKAKSDSQRSSIPSNSIVEVMRFSHKVAEYYVRASYGNVVRVSDEHALKDERRAITPDGLGSGNYSMFRCDIDDGDLVFGQAARERALVAKTRELDQLSKQRDLIEKEYHRTARIQELMDSIKAIECTSIIKEMLTLYSDLDKNEAALSSLDLSEYVDLEEQLETLNARHGEVDSLVQELNGRIGGYQTDEKNLADRVKQLDGEKEKLLSQKDAKEEVVLSVSGVYPEHDAEQRIAQADEQCSLPDDDQDFDQLIERAIKELEALDRKLYEQIRVHNLHNSTFNHIAVNDTYGDAHDLEYFKSIVGVARQIESVYNALKNNVLAGKHEELESLKESFNTAFVTNLCHSIYQAINEGKRVLDSLNKELENHVFGTDQERFSFDCEWVPEFRDYYRFFKEIIEIPNLGDGATLFDAQLSEKSHEVRDTLLSMLLAKDAQSAFRELERISDYRNYRRYEIYKEPLNKDKIALSRYGTGSGGQLETPAYIIRSAAVTSAFKFNEGNSHCRMVLVDEAFSKMDETRSREVINYLTEALGLQLIFIMPTSKSGPFLDLISNQIVFSKCPAQEKIGELETQVLVDRKVCNQERIKELWANHRKSVRHQGMLDFMEDIV